MQDNEKVGRGHHGDAPSHYTAPTQPVIPNTRAYCVGDIDQRSIGGDREGLRVVETCPCTSALQIAPA